MCHDTRRRLTHMSLYGVQSHVLRKVLCKAVSYVIVRCLARVLTRACVYAHKIYSRVAFEFANPTKRESLHELQ